uniref:Phage baseplate assembly protein n=1 Tax=Hydrogenovibrio crunogenus (strain DSM 25203 / XCL-2) TaxID=317025 RepID=Q31HT9_HYDCU
MIGMDRTTGKVISDEAYLKDRIQSCLSMRLGTHPMRRDKGSRIPDLIDAPSNTANLFEMKVAVVDALNSDANGFSDLNVKKIVINPITVAGKVNFDVVIEQSGIAKTLSGIEVSR